MEKDLESGGVTLRNRVRADDRRHDQRGLAAKTH